VTSVAVVIPYYQRKPGILRRALTSVLEQKVPPAVSVHIIVTDDGSPAASEPEIEGLIIAPPFTLELIRQVNQGAGAARNSGLKAVSPDVAYIAFLDSDDLWEPKHLAEALFMLELGYDYFFCDNQRLGAHRSYFHQTQFDNYLAAHGEPLCENRYAIDAPEFFSFSLRAWTSLTPTVVFRRSIAAGHLFSRSLRAAGEDCLFLLKVMSCTSRVCCSTAVNVICADGVNIFYSKYDWDDPGHLVRQMGQLMKSYHYLEQLSLSPADRRYVLTCIKRERRDFAFFSLRSFVKNKFRWPAGFYAMVRQDFDFWHWYPLHAIYVLFSLPLHLYSPPR
jgi:succinoglycan biosynthesis protein ExoW